MVYYVVKFLSGPYTLQDYKTVDKKVIKSGELIVKDKYLSIIKANINCYWQQFGMKENVIIEIHTIFHP